MFPPSRCPRCSSPSVSDVVTYTACPDCGNPWPPGLQSLVGKRESPDPQKVPANAPQMPPSGPQRPLGAFLAEEGEKGAGFPQNAPKAPESRIYAFSGPYAFLSNFWPVSVELDGIAYQSVEHGYQAAKSTDPEAREAIRTARTPSLAKRLGRRLALRPDWNAVRLSIMADLLEQKFSRPALRLALLQTGATEIVEGNRWHDTWWGRCYCDRCGGRGHNHLGRLLMALRARLS